MSGRHATEQGFFESRQRLVCGCFSKCVGHDDTAPTFPSNPRHLSHRIVSMLVSADRCAKCLGELYAGLECKECGYDWKPWMNASKARITKNRTTNAKHNALRLRLHEVEACRW